MNQNQKHCICYPSLDCPITYNKICDIWDSAYWASAGKKEPTMLARLLWRYDTPMNQNILYDHRPVWCLIDINSPDLTFYNILFNAYPQFNSETIEYPQYPFTYSYVIEKFILKWTKIIPCLTQLPGSIITKTYNSLTQKKLESWEIIRSQNLSNTDSIICDIKILKNNSSNEPKQTFQFQL